MTPHYWGDFWALTLQPGRGLDRLAVRRPGRKGVIQAFRRAECAQESITVKLRGLDPAATYELS